MADANSIIAKAQAYADSLQQRAEAFVATLQNVAQPTDPLVIASGPGLSIQAAPFIDSISAILGQLNGQTPTAPAIVTPNAQAPTAPTNADPHLKCPAGRAHCHAADLRLSADLWRMHCGRTRKRGQRSGRVRMSRWKQYSLRVV